MTKNRQAASAAIRAGLVAGMVLTTGGMGERAGTAVPPPVTVPQPRPAQTPPPAPAPEAPALRIVEAADVAPDAFLWQARPVVIFADSAADAALAAQRGFIDRDPAPLVARDVVVIVDTDPAAATAWRRALRPRGFQLVVLDKDGSVIDRKPLPWSAREIARAIDKTPLRRQEIGRRAALP